MATGKIQYYRQIVSAVTEGRIDPAYFIYGGEVYLIDRLIERISKKFLGDIQKEINYFVRYAPDASLEAVLALMAGGGLFSAQKVIVYKDYQNARNPDLEGLKRYLQHPDPNIRLIILARIDSITQAKYKALRAVATTVNVLPLRERELESFIKEEFQKNNKTITSEALQSLLYLVGEKIHDLKAEIEQVIHQHEDKQQIGPAEIETVVGVYVNQNIFELTRVIARKEMEKSRFILHNLLEKGESPGSILFFLLRHLTILWKIRGFHQSGVRNDQTIQSSLKLYSRHYGEYVKELSNWKTSQLTAALQIIGESDRALKSGQTAPAVILDSLIFRLIHLNS